MERATVLLRLDAPIQSWGSGSAFEQRDTESVPTKSGVLGLVAACLGRARGADLGDLASCPFAVRTDQAGAPLTDFQTIGAAGWYSAAGRTVPGPPKLSTRHYLADAVFAAALTAPQPLAEQIASALRRPVYTPFLGRKSCPPAAPLLIAVTQDADPVAALAALPYQGRTAEPELLRITYEDPDGTDSLNDQPVTPPLGMLRHAARNVSTVLVSPPCGAPSPPPRTDDPYAIEFDLG